MRDVKKSLGQRLANSAALSTASTAHVICEPYRWIWMLSLLKSPLACNLNIGLAEIFVKCGQLQHG